MTGNGMIRNVVHNNKQLQADIQISYRKSSKTEMPYSVLIEHVREHLNKSARKTTGYHKFPYKAFSEGKVSVVGWPPLVPKKKLNAMSRRHLIGLLEATITLKPVEPIAESLQPTVPPTIPESLPPPTIPERPPARIAAENTTDSEATSILERLMMSSTDDKNLLESIVAATGEPDETDDHDGATPVNEMSSLTETTAIKSEKVTVKRIRYTPEEDDILRTSGLAKTVSSHQLSSLQQRYPLLQSRSHSSLRHKIRLLHRKLQANTTLPTDFIL
ncbi:uncharacterized protein [Littorina saxatilis]|uniref:uncharacterized protein n=1 Tax=Littorina saxatilis TaxID=31220 RepID=UPI0038B5FBF9